MTTLRFLSGMIQSTPGKLGSPLTLDGANGAIEADLYTPRRKPWASVVLLHGLALRAHRDPRLVKIANVLADCGVIVTVPKIPAMAKLHLDPVAWPEIADVLRGVLADPDLRGPGRVGVFAPSYAGGQVIRSAIEPDLVGQLSCFMLVGPYADGRALVRHVFQQHDADPYGRLVVMRHALWCTGALTEGLERAIDTALADSGLHQDPPELPAVLASIPEPDRDRFLSLRDDVEVRKAYTDEIFASHGHVIDGLSVLDALSTFDVPTALLHGASDPIIPASESITIHGLLQARGAVSRLCTTALLDHGNVMAKGKNLLDLPALAATFRFWFSGLRT